ncbi:MAG: glycosyltransferase family 39 protein, partial [candidate division WOR-3 bacterium]
ARLDLDPHYYVNPSLHYYTLLAAFLKANVVGLGLTLPVAEDNPFKPATLAARTYTGLFLVGRVLVVIQSVTAILLLFFIGRRLYGSRAGLFSALLMATSYPCVYQSHFLVTDAPAVFWMVLALYFVIRLRAEPGRRVWRVLAPVSIGLAIGAKYTNVLLMLPYLYVLAAAKAVPRRRPAESVIARALKGALLAAGAFLVTTPYTLLSLPRFLFGDKQGFGGIFGARGLVYYNNFPPSLVEPFWVATPAALGIFGAVLFGVAVVLALLRRRGSDLLLLSFILPFYLLLVLKSSTMLRHILPVLPFAFLVMAGVLSEDMTRFWDTIPIPFGNRVMSRAALALLCLLAAYWAAFSLAAVLRMTRTDTRVQVEQWVRLNVTTERIVLPTYFPFRYTPAIDSFNVVGVNYDPRAIDDLKPDYIILTEPEFTVSGRTDGQAAQKLVFFGAVQRHPEYRLALRFAEPFRLGPLRFKPKFPTEDWSFPSPEILVYRRALTLGCSGG